MLFNIVIAGISLITGETFPFDACEEAVRLKGDNILAAADQIYETST